MGLDDVGGRARSTWLPYSFFNAIGEGPPMLAFSSSGAKDSATFAGELREFVWNLVTFDLREQMNETSAPLPRGRSEFERAGLEMAPSTLVAPPRVAAARCAMECKVVHALELHDVDGRSVDQHLVIGQVVGVHLDESAIVDGTVDTAAAAPGGQAGRPRRLHGGRRRLPDDPADRVALRAPEAGKTCAARWVRRSAGRFAAMRGVGRL